MVAPRWILVTAALVITCGAAHSSAQTDSTVSLGAGVAFYHPAADSARDAIGFALVYRFGRPQAWRPAFGFNWFGLDFDANVGGEQVPLGHLRVRPIMGGYGYTLQRGRLSTSATLIGGYAFNSFEPDSRAVAAYRRSLQTLLRISAANSLAARAEIAVWYDASARIGILSSIGYVVTRPEISIITDAGVERRGLRADALKLQIGVA
jgi:hypothetical protein